MALVGFYVCLYAADSLLFFFVCCSISFVRFFAIVMLHFRMYAIESVHFFSLHLFLTYFFHFKSHCNSFINFRLLMLLSFWSGLCECFFSIRCITYHIWLVLGTNKKKDPLSTCCGISCSIEPATDLFI